MRSILHKANKMLSLVKRTLQQVALFSICAGLSVSASALQVLEGVDGEVLTGKLSIKEPTRLSIAGAKIQKWFHNEGELILERDVDNGQLFIKPVQLLKPINMFLVDDGGHTYTLLLQPTDIPAENILVKDRRARHEEPSIIERSGSYNRIVKDMILAMAVDAAPRGIEVREMKTPIMLWREVKFVMTGLYIGKAIVGERFSLTNITDKNLVIAEQEFFKRGVLAVSVENQNIPAGDSTNVYVVREKGENE